MVLHRCCAQPQTYLVIINLIIIIMSGSDDSLCAQRATDVCVAVGVAAGVAVVATVDSLCARSATDISVAVGVADGVAVAATVGVSEGVSDVHSPNVQRTCELYLLKRF
jgi:hypothetical protein